jgi:hypothetical protein
MSARRRALALLPCALLGACYWSDAARHAGPIARTSWDVERWGPWVVVTGPVGSTWAGLDLLARSVVPAARAEPEETWFRFYTGPMLPLERVAVLCNAERSSLIYTIRLMDGGAPFPARYEKWHFPICIEALPGVYELSVHYFLRRTDDVRDETSTQHAESVQPSRVAWYAEAGGVYALRVVVGDTQTAATAAPRSRVSRRSSLGTARFELEEGEWAAEIERLNSFDAIDAPVLEYRQAWNAYERSHSR